MSDDIASISHISRTSEPATVHRRDGDNNTASDAESSFSANQDSVQEDDEFEQAFQSRADAMMEYLKQRCEIPGRLDLSYTPRGAVRAEYLNSFFSRVAQICSEVLQPTVKTGLNTVYLVHFLSNTADFIEAALQPMTNVLTKTALQRLLCEEIRHDLTWHSQIPSAAAQLPTLTDCSLLVDCVKLKEANIHTEHQMMVIMITTARDMVVIARKIFAVQQRFSPRGLAKTDRGWALIMLQHALALEKRYAVLRVLHQRIGQVERWVREVDAYLAKVRVKVQETKEDGGEVRTTTFSIVEFARYLKQVRLTGKVDLVCWLVSVRQDSYDESSDGSATEPSIDHSQQDEAIDGGDADEE